MSFQQLTATRKDYKILRIQENEIIGSKKKAFGFPEGFLFYRSVEKIF